jgi:hypothetical protein
VYAVIRFVAVAATAGAVAAGNAGAAVSPAAAQSSNWAGYVAAATPLSGYTPAVPPAALAFTNVTGTWVQPKAHCPRGANTSAAFWVGLGGSDPSSVALEQIGTEIDCSASGAARHAAWWEILPAPPVAIRMKIAAGDTITTAVLVRGTSVTLQITNRTRHTRFTKVATVAAPDLSSAEWIAEAPSLCSSAGRCTPVSLANFGTSSFTGAAATANGHSGVISDDTWTATPVQLVPGSSSGDGLGSFFGPAPTSGAALPGPIAADGRSFSVRWRSGTGS